MSLFFPTFIGNTSFCFFPSGRSGREEGEEVILDLLEVLEYRLVPASAGFHWCREGCDPEKAVPRLRCKAEKV